MHPLYGALHESYVPARVTRSALDSNWYVYAPPVQNLIVPQWDGSIRLYMSCIVPLPIVSVERFCWPCIRWCETGGFPEQNQWFFIGLSCHIPFCLLLFYTFSSFCLLHNIVGLGSQNWLGVDHFLPALHYWPCLIIIIISLGSGMYYKNYQALNSNSSIARTHTHTHIYTHTHTYIYIHTHTHTYLCTCVWCGIALLSCGTGGFHKQDQCFFIGLSGSIPFCLLLYSLFFLFFYMLVYRIVWHNIVACVCRQSHVTSCLIRHIFIRYFSKVSRIRE